MTTNSHHSHQLTPPYAAATANSLIPLTLTPPYSTDRNHPSIIMNDALRSLSGPDSRSQTTQNGSSSCVRGHAFDAGPVALARVALLLSQGAQPHEAPRATAVCIRAVSLNRALVLFCCRAHVRGRRPRLCGRVHCGVALNRDRGARAHLVDSTRALVQLLSLPHVVNRCSLQLTMMAVHVNTPWDFLVVSQL